MLFLKNMCTVCTASTYGVADVDMCLLEITIALWPAAGSAETAG